MANRKCWIDGCDYAVSDWGMCASHRITWDDLVRVTRTRLTGGDAERFEYYTVSNPSQDVQEIFGAKPDCLIWGGGLNFYGYGQFRSDWAKTSDGSVFAHLYAWVNVGGHVRDLAMETDHRCRFRPCVNVGHLEQVPQRINTLRGVSPAAQNFRKEECDSGHAFTSENTFINDKGHRSCRECSREANREYVSRPEVKAARIEAYEPVTGVRGKGQYQAERDACGEGHELEGDNLVLEKRKKKSGEITHIRRCRICMNAKNRKNHALRNGGEVAPGVKREDCVTSTEAAGILDIKPTYFTTFVRRADGFPEPIKKGSPNLYERMAVVAWQNEKAPTE